MHTHATKFASPNTSMLLSNAVHGYLRAIRGFWILGRIALVMAMRSSAWRGHGSDQIPSLSTTVLDLSVAKKLNRAATLWNSISPFQVRRSSSSLISSRRSIHLPFCEIRYLTCLTAARIICGGVAFRRIALLCDLCNDCTCENVACGKCTCMHTVDRQGIKISGKRKSISEQKTLLFSPR